MRTEDQLLEHADPFFGPALLAQPGTAESLDMKVEQLGLVHRSELVDIVATAVFARVDSVAPLGMKITDSGHEELKRTVRARSPPRCRPCGEAGFPRALHVSSQA